MHESEQLLKKDNFINNTVRRFDSFCSTLTRMYVAAQRCLTSPSMLMPQFVDNFSEKQIYILIRVNKLQLVIPEFNF